MASTETAVPKSTNVITEQPENGSADNLADALAKAQIQAQEPSSTVNEGKDQPQPPRPLHVYSRVDVLLLSKSSLVKMPEGMPNLKDWFGDWNEQQISNKKEGETPGTSTNPRDRRFRRDAEDGDAPTRPSFRTTLSQPSQMGNFRHQSLRTTERERDAERERQRDERDREGQERLRNLSDKYDREKLALTSGATGPLRNRERDSAPHLSSGSSTRKKPGETSDDWRRGADPSRANRDELRRDRDRPRESSRSRREPSSTRRDRDRDDRDRPRRGDDRDDRRDKDDYGRRDRDDYFRRDWDDRERDDSYRDRDRDRYEYGRHAKDLDRGERETDEDPRRWRDDGRRDERMAARRDRDRENTRGWDRWEPSHDRDRLEDRDGRSKRISGRDRRSGGLDEPRDREDKKEREKEKEPAWMETYIPTTPGGGILGGQTEGQLDGIQAWKKGMKEKEKKSKEGEASSEAAKKGDEGAESAPQAVSAPGEAPMDEIQMFKLMMRREAAKKETEQGQNGTAAPSVPTPQPVENGSSSAPKERTDSASPVPSPGSAPTNRNELPAHPLKSFTPSTSVAPSTSESGARLLSLISSPSDNTSSSASVIAKPSTPGALEQSASRLFGNPPGLSPSTLQPDRLTVDLSNSVSPNTTQFNPPVGSRLLAFGSRTIAPNANATNAPSKVFSPSEGTLPPGNLLSNMVIPNAQKLGGMTPPPPGIGMNMGLQGADVEPQFGTNPRATPSERSIRSFSPFGQPQPLIQGGYAVDEIQEAMRLAQASEGLRRQPGMSPAERAGLGLGGDSNHQYIDLGRASPSFPVNAGAYDAGGIGAAAKGSRFAKFFDAKHREAQPGPVMRKGPVGPGLAPTPPLPGQRVDSIPLGGMGVNVGENRTMEDLFAMLQSSAQGHRVSPQINQPGRVSASGFGQSPVDLHALQQQQFLQNARQDSLYESRLDDRNFVPDGMVPGLRPAARPRSREPTGVLFTDQSEEILHINMQRIPQQQRNLEQMYSGPVPTLYNQQAGMVRNGGAALQQAQFRGSPAALASQQNVLPGPSQRLPPGLANLGGRPPHDPSQFMGSHVGGLHGGIHPNAPAQQGFNNFGGGGPGFNTGLGVRGPLPGSHHQNPLAVNQLGGLAGGLTAGNNIDLRGPNQLLGMSAGGLGGGLRGGVGAGFNPQHPPASQLQQVQQMAFRQQQQQQHVPPHMVSHMLPPHLQQQQQAMGNAQGTQDLMALLMGGHRE